jgi:RNA polymerase sigma-70 factor (ECF subfamily)
VARQIDTETPQSLLLRIRDRDDQQSWFAFVDVYSPLIYVFCRARKLQESDAADVTQEVLLRVAKAIETFEYDSRKGLFRNWLARIVINEIRRFATKNKGKETASRYDDESIGEVESEWNEHYQSHILHVALERTKVHFTANVWRLFVESWIENSPPPEVAERLQTSVEQVYVARSRVLKRLRHEVCILADDLI